MNDRFLVVAQAHAAALELTKAAIGTLNTTPDNLVTYFGQLTDKLIVKMMADYKLNGQKLKEEQEA